MPSIRKAFNMFTEWKPVGELRGFWTTSSLRGRWEGGIWDWTLEDNFKNENNINKISKSWGCIWEGDRKLRGIKKWRNFPLILCRLKKQGQNADKKIYLPWLYTFWTTLSIQMNVEKKTKQNTKTTVLGRRVGCYIIFKQLKVSVNWW